MVKFIKTRDYDEMSRKAAELIGAQLAEKPDSVLGLATGSTPLGAYGYLAEEYAKGKLDFSGITSINLDEFKGLAHDNKYSYYQFMYRNLFSKVNIDLSRAFVPDGGIADADRACREYDKIIEAAGGIDLQLLGLGHNGHIGFNEPAEVFLKKTHCVDLAQSTISANSIFFSSEKEVPSQAYTMGIQSIMEAKKILLLVSGDDKAAIIKKVFFGDITPRVPASVLQLHQDVTVVGDEAAFSQISCSI